MAAGNRARPLRASANPARRNALFVRQPLGIAIGGDRRKRLKVILIASVRAQRERAEIGAGGELADRGVVLLQRRAVAARLAIVRTAQESEIVARGEIDRRVTRVRGDVDG